MDKITALISDIRSGKNVKVTADDLAWIRESLKDPENDKLHQFARGYLCTLRLLEFSAAIYQ